MSDISVMTLRENAIIKIKMGEIQGKTERGFFWLYSEKQGGKRDETVVSTAGIPVVRSASDRKRKTGRHGIWKSKRGDDSAQRGQRLERKTAEPDQSGRGKVSG